MKFLLAISFNVLAFFPVIRAQSVVINEIMYAPIKPEPEWVELFNPSDSSVAMIGWQISDLSKSYLIPDQNIPAQGYVVLSKDSAALQAKYSNYPITIVQMAMPSLNNSGDLILIRDSSGRIVDSVTYSASWGGGGGKSLERIDYAAGSDASNFGSATDSATPGAPNSIRRRDYDLAIESLSFTVQDENDILFTATVANRGRKEISEGLITVSHISGLPIAEAQLPLPLAPLARIEIPLIWHDPNFGRESVIVFLSQSEDERRSNDTIEKSIYVPIPPKAIVINEIMATPSSSSSQWIELLNTTSSMASLDSLMLRIGGADTTYEFRIGEVQLDPKHYAVIAAGTKFFSSFPFLKNLNGVAVLGKSDLKLSADDAMIELVNIDGSIIDSLHYYSSWHSPNVGDHRGISLERKESSAPESGPSSWTSSLDPQGSTPLRKNSFFLDSSVAPSAVDVRISPNPFSPDGDGYHDAADITISIPSDNEEVVSAQLYDLQGRLRSTIARNRRIYRTESLTFEGKDDNGIALPIGLYTLVVDSPSGHFNPQRKGVVIMKKAR
ncbi:MAG: lamin tail domain-containing protein [Bacteroidota bacterium]|nr:lamin tail domain-containing protein [Bacteroidota bacterium]